MFKYLWIVILGLILLILVIITIVDLVKCYIENYDYYIKQEHGRWRDVIEGTFEDLDDFIWKFWIVFLIIITMISFGLFLLSA